MIVPFIVPLYTKVVRFLAAFNQKLAIKMRRFYEDEISTRRSHITIR